MIVVIASLKMHKEGENVLNDKIFSLILNFSLFLLLWLQIKIIKCCSAPVSFQLGLLEIEN